MAMLVRMPPLHRKQEEIRRSKARFKVAACGRRFGKTLLGATAGLETGLTGGAAWWVGPTSREAGIGWRAMTMLSRQIPGAAVKLADKEIHYPGGGWVGVLSAESQTLRGEGLNRIIVDEAAYLRSLLKTWQEDLRAALSDRQGDALFLSSANGRDDFYQLHRRGQSPDHPEWASWQCTTYDNPFIARAEIEAARRELPDWVFRQEYLAEFVSFAGKVYKTFTPESASVFTFAGDLSPYTEYWGGIDFGFRNPTVVSVGGLDRDDRLDIIDGVYAREMTTPDLLDTLWGFQRQYNVRRWFADPADPNTIAQLKAAGPPVVGAPRVKNDLDRTFIKDGLVKVETRLVNGKLRIADRLPDHIREMDVYRYPGEREGAEEKESPLKVDDHAPDSIRYMVVGLDHLRGRMPQIVVAA